MQAIASLHAQLQGATEQLEVSTRSLELSRKEIKHVTAESSEKWKDDEQLRDSVKSLQIQGANDKDQLLRLQQQTGPLARDFDSLSSHLAVIPFSIYRLGRSFAEESGRQMHEIESLKERATKEKFWREKIAGTAKEAEENMRELRDQTSKNRQGLEEEERFLTKQLEDEESSLSLVLGCLTAVQRKNVELSQHTPVCSNNRQHSQQRAFYTDNQQQHQPNQRIYGQHFPQTQRISTSSFGHDSSSSSISAGGGGGGGGGGAGGGGSRHSRSFSNARAPSAESLHDPYNQRSHVLFPTPGYEGMPNPSVFTTNGTSSASSSAGSSSYPPHRTSEEQGHRHAGLNPEQAQKPHAQLQKQHLQHHQTQHSLVVLRDGGCEGTMQNQNQLQRHVMHTVTHIVTEELIEEKIIHAKVIPADINNSTNLAFEPHTRGERDGADDGQGREAGVTDGDDGDGGDAGLLIAIDNRPWYQMIKRRRLSGGGGESAGSAKAAEIDNRYYPDCGGSDGVRASDTRVGATAAATAATISTVAGPTANDSQSVSSFLSSLAKGREEELSSGAGIVSASNATAPPYHSSSSSNSNNVGNAYGQQVPFSGGALARPSPSKPSVPDHQKQEKASFKTALELMYDV